MEIVGTAKRWYHKGWVRFSFAFFLGLLAATIILGISMPALWASFKGRYLQRAA